MLFIILIISDNVIVKRFLPNTFSHLFGNDTFQLFYHL